MTELALREEYIVCRAAGYPDPYRPTPNTFDDAIRFAAEHNFDYSTGQRTHPVIKRRLVTDWEEVE